MTLENYINDYFKKVGIAESNLLNNMKKRNIRIQLCMKGIDVDKLGNISIEEKDTLQKVESILGSIKI